MDSSPGASETLSGPLGETLDFGCLGQLTAGEHGTRQLGPVSPPNSSIKARVAGWTA
jgi:hypothetical protein